MSHLFRISFSIIFCFSFLVHAQAQAPKPTAAPPPPPAKAPISTAPGAAVVTNREKPLLGPSPVNIKETMTPQMQAKSSELDALIAKRDAAGAENLVNQLSDSLYTDAPSAYPPYFVWTLLWKKLLLNYTYGRPVEVTYAQIGRWLDKYFPNAPSAFKDYMDTFIAGFINAAKKKENYFIILDDFLNRFFDYHEVVAGQSMPYHELMKLQCDNMIAIHSFTKALNCLDTLGRAVQANLTRLPPNDPNVLGWKGLQFDVTANKALIAANLKKTAEAEQMLMALEKQYPPTFNTDYAKLYLWNVYATKDDGCKKVKTALGDVIRSQKMNKNIIAWYYNDYIALTDCVENLATELTYADTVIANFATLDPLISYRGEGYWAKARLLYLKGDMVGAVTNMNTAIQATPMGASTAKLNYYFDQALLYAVAGKKAEAATLAKRFLAIATMLSKISATDDGFIENQKDLMNVLVTKVDDPGQRGHLQTRLEAITKDYHKGYRQLRLAALIVKKGL